MCGYGQWDSEGYMSGDGFYPTAPPTPAPVEKLVNYSPDRRPSSGRQVYDNTDGSIRRLLDVRGLGVLVFRVSEGHFDGKLAFEGLSSFTHQQLLI